MEIGDDADGWASPVGEKERGERRREQARLAGWAEAEAQFE
jgi:hypothetical protein